ncbi:unnamed protein product [Candida verbasci]|uniref:Zn(2)-C6 fungal-type domain-containing protein n=1 Tax=Candida verbasci TaxID=1227364 RepID=A0A9W4XI80_9ASCO|nr:unnamed protein product [Candida verbasci]
MARPENNSKAYEPRQSTSPSTDSMSNQQQPSTSTPGTSNANTLGGLNYISNESNVRNSAHPHSHAHPVPPTSSNYLPHHYHQQLPSLLNFNNPNSIQNTQLPMVDQQLKQDQQQKQQKATKSRLRVSRACDRCRTHKIKCTGTNPCSTCLRQKKECTFSKTSQAANISTGGNDESSSFKRQRILPLQTEPFGLPVMDKTNQSDYISHLENRVQYLENLLTENSNNLFKQPKTQEPEIDSIINTIFSTSSKWRFSRRHQNLLIVELCRSMYSNLSEESKKLVTIPRTQYFGWNMSGVNYIKIDDLPNKPENDLTLEEVNQLIDYFFKEINPLFAIIHDTVFREQFEAYLKLKKLEQEEKEKEKEKEKEVDAQQHDSKTNQTKLFSAILYLILALSIRFHEFQKPKGPNIDRLKLEENLFKYGYKVVSILSFEWESFELIQSWLLISLYLRISHRQTSCSHALNQAIIMTKSMGLGFDEENPKILISTNYERLKAKRIFWCVFTFDRIFGLQTGRYCGIRDEDSTRPFPDFNYFNQENLKDDWLTLPALALIQIAKISNFIHTLPNDNPHLIKYQQVNTELVRLNDWFNEIGFRNDLLYKVDHHENNTAKFISSLVKAQVKLHYYDLVMCIHGKVLFNYIGKRIASHGLKVELVIDSCFGVIDVLDKTNKAGLLYTPWYSNLLLLFNIGVNSITIINGGIFIEQSRTILKNSIRLLNILKKSPIRNDKNKLIFRERFKMARECTWALKMANKMLTLRLQEDINALNNIGIDHGSSDVNLQTFSQLGRLESNSNNIKNKKTKTNANDENKSNEFNKIFEKQLYRNEDYEEEEEEEEEEEDYVEPDDLPDEEKQDMINQRINHNNHTPISDNSSSMDFNNINVDGNNINPIDNYNSQEIDNLLGNIQWFDQWIDI